MNFLKITQDKINALKARLKELNELPLSAEIEAEIEELEAELEAELEDLKALESSMTP